MQPREDSGSRLLFWFHTEEAGRLPDELAGALTSSSLVRAQPDAVHEGLSGRRGCCVCPVMDAALRIRFV